MQPSNAVLLSDEIFELNSNVMFERDLQFLNALSPIVVQFAGMLIDVRLTQFLNILLPNEDKAQNLPNVNVVRDVQSENIESESKLTSAKSVNVMIDNLVHPENAFCLTVRRDVGLSLIHI